MITATQSFPNVTCGTSRLTSFAVFDSSGAAGGGSTSCGLVCVALISTFGALFVIGIFAAVVLLVRHARRPGKEAQDCIDDHVVASGGRWGIRLPEHYSPTHRAESGSQPHAQVFTQPVVPPTLVIPVACREVTNPINEQHAFTPIVERQNV